MEIIIVLLINVGLLALMFIYFRNKMRKALDPRVILEKIQDEMDKMIVEINQITDRNIGILEDRISSLQELLSLAEKRVMLMKREVEKQDFNSSVYSHLAGRKKIQEQPDPISPKQEQLPGLEPVPEESALKTHVQKVIPIGSKKTDTAVPSADQPRTKKEIVAELFQRGLDAAQIAAQLGISAGEAEVYISMVINVKK